MRSAGNKPQDTVWLDLDQADAFEIVADDRTAVLVDPVPPRARSHRSDVASTALVGSLSLESRV
jgi:hypothetical protein